MSFSSVYANGYVQKPQVRKVKPWLDDVSSCRVGKDGSRTNICGNNSGVPMVGRMRMDCLN